MDILRWLASVLRSAVGWATADWVDPPPLADRKERRLLGHHEDIALHVVRDDPRAGDVSITAELEWVFAPDKIGVRQVRTWITTRDVHWGCGCGCGYSCEGEETGEITVMRDYPYDNGAGVVQRNVPDFATAMQVARSAAEREIDKQLAENREEREKHRRNTELRQSVDRMFNEGVDQWFCDPGMADSSGPIAGDDGTQPPADPEREPNPDDWKDAFAPAVSDQVLDSHSGPGKQPADGGDEDPEPVRAIDMQAARDWSAWQCTYGHQDAGRP